MPRLSKSSKPFLFVSDETVTQDGTVELDVSVLSRTPMTHHMMKLANFYEQQDLKSAATRQRLIRKLIQKKATAALTQ